jgi:hypothetical protein
MAHSRRPRKLPTDWYAPSQAPVSGTLFVLQVEADDNGLPLAYGYGTANATLTNGMGASTTVDVDPVTPSTLQGSVTVPSGYTAIVLNSYLSVPPTGGLELFSTSSPPEEFSFLVPFVGGNTVSVVVLANAEDGSFWVGEVGVRDKDAPAISISCPPAPTLLTPSDQMTGVTGATTLSWSAYPNGVYQLILGAASYWMASSSTSIAALPDLSSFGFSPFQASVEHYWQVYAVAPYPTVDSLTDPETALAPLPSFCEGVTPTRTFTTAAPTETDGGSASNGRSTLQARAKVPVGLPTFR